MAKPTLFVAPGERYGRGTVLREVRRNDVRCVEMRCDCGTTYVAAIKRVVSGHTASCGCLKIDVVVARNQAPVHPRRTHGLHDHPHYDRWVGIMARCHRPESKDFHRYGARGISVHPAWHDISVFIHYLDTVLGPCPPGHSLDRIDNDGNYEPGNVRWADASTQNGNRRKFRRGTRGHDMAVHR